MLDGKKWTASEMGYKGGLARAKKLTAERRSQIAQLGGIARWSKAKTIKKRKRE